MDLKPLPGYALVRLKKLESGLQTEKDKYAMRSRGILITISTRVPKEMDAVEKETWEPAIGHEVYFAPFEDGEPVKFEGEDYVFLPIKELRGVNYAKA